MPIEWEAIDWTKPDQYLAELYGCSRQTVNNHRRRLQKPMPERSLRDFEEKANVLAKWIDEDPDRAEQFTVLELGEKFDLSGSSVRRVCKQKEVTPKLAYSSKVPYKLFDWRLPNRVLVAIWYGHIDSLRVANVCVAKARRQHGEPPKWDLRRHDHREDPQLELATMNQELERQAWEQQQP